MKDRKIIYVSVFSIVFIAFFMLALKPYVQEQEKWNVPEKYNKMENPVASDPDALEIGEELYMKHCKSCHGKTGLGDGTKAAELDTPSGDFTTEEFHSQTDGALYYKTTIGRDDMPSFKKKLAEDEDRWSVVSYIRTLAE